MSVDAIKARALANFEDSLRDGLEAQIRIYGQLGIMIDVRNSPVELSDNFAQGSDDVVAKVLREYEAVGWKTNWCHFLDDDDSETSFRITLA